MYQYIIVAVILLLAVGYAVWRLYKNFSHTDDSCCNCGCKDCALKEHCTKIKQ